MRIRKKEKLIEVYEEWRKGWETPDVYVKKDRRKKMSEENKLFLKYHIAGKRPYDETVI